VRVRIVLHVGALLRGVPPEDPVARAEHLVDAGKILVLRQDVGDSDDGVYVEDVLRRELRKGQVLVQQVLSVPVNPAWGNDVGDISGAVAEGLPGKWIKYDGGRPDGFAVADERGKQSGKIAVPKRHGSAVRLRYALQRLAGTFVVEAPEGFVLAPIVRHDHRTGQPGAVLVAAQPVLLLQRRAGRQLEVQKIIRCVRGVVSQEFLEAAVKVVGTRFQRDLYDGSVVH